MVISGKLNSTDIRRMADEVRQYANTLETRIQTFLERLADKGIVAAEQNAGNFGSRIVFSRQTESDGVVMVATETSVIVSEWLRYDEPVQAEVSPLLMAEFGAGPHAIVWEGKNRHTDVLPDGKHIGRGTFTYPEKSHGIQDSWWYMDLNKNWHQVRGVKPTRPLHNAVLEIIAQVKATAREVFDNGSI